VTTTRKNSDDESDVAKTTDPESRPQATVAAPTCLNCGTSLAGQYCAACGQRASGRLISLWELLRDAFGDLFEMDSRLWRTLKPLMLKPGALTLDYLQGRRARYLPPFRTYLVLSLLFFLVAFFDPQRELGILFEAPPETIEAEQQPTAPNDADVESSEEVVDEGDSGVITNCDIDDLNPDEMPQWLARRLTPERAKALCERIEADGAQGFLANMIEVIPTALFVLLPLLALALKFLYSLSKRYYVEHLLFVLNFHAFFFLLLTLEVIFSRLVSVTPLSGVLVPLSGIAATVYIFWYLYKSMRHVYGQGRFLTTLKFTMFCGTYLIGTMLTLALVAVFAVLTA